MQFADPMLRNIAARELNPSDASLAPYPLLTDDFAPVEYYAASAIRQYDAVANRLP
jgi:hypothetical protein